MFKFRIHLEILEKNQDDEKLTLEGIKDAFGDDLIDRSDPASEVKLLSLYKLNEKGIWEVIYPD